MAVLTVILAAIKSALALVGLGKIAILPFIIASMAYYNYDLFDPENRPITVDHVDHAYDFVIIGGGSAGSVLANRLTEIEHWKVLLLEAGGHETEITDIPILSLYLHKSKVDWAYRPQPQPSACQAMRDKRCSWTRGKVLGGSSVLNTMLYIRGNRRDYDNWRALGNDGWGFDDVLPYFKKSQDQRNPYLAKDTRYHATGGYQTVQDNPYYTPLGIAFLEAGQEMGYDVRDVNGDRQTGFALFQYTIRRGTRCSTSKAFLRPIRLRQNLHISIYSHVTRILIDGATRRAYGVEFAKNGKRHRVTASKEVILSAGAINSPQLLMLSGVGPRADLERLGIRVVRDAPGVGRNLQDHIAAGVTFLVDYPVSMLLSRLVNLNTALRYAVKEDGPLTSSVGLETVGFVSTKYANRSDDWPDIEYMCLSTSTNGDGGQQVKYTHGLSDAFYKEVFEEINFKDSFAIWPMMMRPRSTGSVRLQSRNPFRYPLLRHNYLTDPADVAVLREGVKGAIALGETYALKRFGSRFWSKPLPNCKHLPLYTDAYWDCYIRQYTLSIYHYSCTCKMGPADDPMAVVDSQLRVRGVHNLRVIDASIMPKITTGNIHAPVIMIGEKGADMVKEHWLRHERNGGGGGGGRRKRHANATASVG